MERRNLSNEHALNREPVPLTLLPEKVGLNREGVLKDNLRQLPYFVLLNGLDISLPFHHMLSVAYCDLSEQSSAFAETSLFPG